MDEGQPPTLSSCLQPQRWWFPVAGIRKGLMKKDCALFLVFIGFLFLCVSLSFLVTHTQPLSLQTISLLTKCTNEMSPPTAGQEDWCARTFFALFEFSFPALPSTSCILYCFFFSTIHLATLKTSMPICNTGLLNWSGLSYVMYMLDNYLMNLCSIHLRLQHPLSQ